jgi:hypothetical protein
MKFLALVLIINLVLIAACNSPAPVVPLSNSNANANIANVPTAAPPPAPDNLTPLQTINSLSAASKSKDLSGIKRRLNKGSLALFEETSDDRGVTVDQLLTEEGGAPLASMSDARNEKIEGDKAFVDVQDSLTKNYETIPLIREDGEWKVALDIYMETLRQRLTDDMKKNPQLAPGKPQPAKP